MLKISLLPQRWIGLGAPKQLVSLSKRRGAAAEFGGVRGEGVHRVRGAAVGAVHWLTTRAPTAAERAAAAKRTTTAAAIGGAHRAARGRKR